MAYVNLGQVIYPVGAYFFSDNSVSPSSLFGGTWIAVDAGRFICAAGSGYAVGAQGGANSVALVCNQLPQQFGFLLKLLVGYIQQILIQHSILVVHLVCILLIEPLKAWFRMHMKIDHYTGLRTYGEEQLSLTLGCDA